MRLAILALLLAAATSRAAHVTVELVQSVAAVEPGGSFTVAAVFKIEKGWHLYWTNPGDTGTPPSIKWTAPPGVAVGPAKFPTPKRINADGLTAYGYEESLVLLYEVTVPQDVKGPLALEAAAGWVVCADACVAERQAASVSVPVAAGRGEVRRPDDFAAWRRALPKPFGQPVVVTVTSDGKHGLIDIRAITIDGAARQPIDFFPPPADFAEWEKLTADGHALRGRCRVLPGAPASYVADGIVLYADPSAAAPVAIIRPVEFKFPVPRKE